MKRLVFCTVLCVLFAFKKGDDKPGNKQPCLSSFDGKAYSYNVAPKRPGWIFYVIFHCEGDSLRGIILGPTMQLNSVGQFFRANINNVRISKDSVSFNFIEGQLYRVPFTPINYADIGGPPPYGFSRDRRMYKGVMKGDSIIDLKCQDIPYSCITDSIVLREIK